MEIGEARAPRAPHRHDYHELIWIRSGAGEQLLDGEAVPVRPGTVTVVGRARCTCSGARSRSAAPCSASPASSARRRRADRRGLDAGRPRRPHRGGPPGRPALADGALRRPRRGGPPPSRSLRRRRRSATSLATLLLWLERWYDGSRAERRDAADADVQLHRRFTARLEADFAAHHDAAHYADALAVPPAALARALTAPDRAVDEGARARPGDARGRAAAALQRPRRWGRSPTASGFDDPLYFSRAFKRRHGAAPLAYRAAARGEG